MRSPLFQYKLADARVTINGSFLNLVFTSYIDGEIQYDTFCLYNRVRFPICGRARMIHTTLDLWYVGRNFTSSRSVKLETTAYLTNFHYSFLKKRSLLLG